MPAGNWIMYNIARMYIGDGVMDMDNDTFKCSLHSATYTPNAETHTNYADLTNEVASGNGYTTAGDALTSVTWTQSTTTVTFDAADPAWTASGADVGPFRYAVIYDDTVTTPEADPLVCYCDLGSNITILDGNTFTIQINASGILTLSGATS